MHCKLQPYISHTLTSRGWRKRPNTYRAPLIFGCHLRLRQRGVGTSSPSKFCQRACLPRSTRKIRGFTHQFCPKLRATNSVQHQQMILVCAHENEKAELALMVQGEPPQEEVRDPFSAEEEAQDRPVDAPFPGGLVITHTDSLVGVVRGPSVAECHPAPCRAPQCFSREVLCPQMWRCLS